MPEPAARAEPTVSVVIPVRDDAEYLERCLRALDEQSSPPLEVIVVDNGSSDASAAVARRYGARVVEQHEVGIPIASATGYDAARGDIIARLDSDSRPGPEWVATVQRLFAEHPEADALTGSGLLETDDGETQPVRSRLYLGPYFTLVRWALANRPVFGSAMALRRSTWERVGDDVCRHDPDVHDDMDLSVHLGPDAVVLFDDRLTLPVSARPLQHVPSMLRRGWRGMYTLARHWPREHPLGRHARRLRARRIAARSD
ncbi:glycosyltransferase family A protein [Microcella alkalica]|uniref:Glycosyltransferase involved in cell wall biosynthesis n=1 Tax=Microcella alkalica TaxID=355930 RepID=A0A839EAC5_9MICO|nr:glycosyltransferase family 2 protein [Microcella alkalica]MBA8848427.1 glycosyltransferase involved in cell wall biosynthesis [Microcella alkalica]